MVKKAEAFHKHVYLILEGGWYSEQNKSLSSVAKEDKRQYLLKLKSHKLASTCSKEFGVEAQSTTNV